MCTYTYAASPMFRCTYILYMCVFINDEHGQETGRLHDFSNCISFSKRLSHFDLIECERDNTAVAIYIYYCICYIIICTCIYIYISVCTFIRRHPSSTVIIITIVSFRPNLYVYNNTIVSSTDIWSHL